MKTLLPFLLLFLSPLAASANFEANVIAASETCKTQFQIRLSDAALVIGRRAYSCIDRVGGTESYEAVLPELRFEIQHGYSVYFRGKPIGAATDGIIKISTVGFEGISQAEQFSFVLYPVDARDGGAELIDSGTTEGGREFTFHGSTIR